MNSIKSNLFLTRCQMKCPNRSEEFMNIDFLNPFLCLKINCPQIQNLKLLLPVFNFLNNFQFYPDFTALLCSKVIICISGIFIPCLLPSPFFALNIDSMDRKQIQIILGSNPESFLKKQNSCPLHWPFLHRQLLPVSHSSGWFIPDKQSAFLISPNRLSKYYAKSFQTLCKMPHIHPLNSCNLHLFLLRSVAVYG